MKKLIFKAKVDYIGDLRSTNELFEISANK